MLALRRRHEHFHAAKAMVLTDTEVEVLDKHSYCFWKLAVFENRGRAAGRVGFRFADAYPK